MANHAHTPPAPQGTHTNVIAFPKRERPPGYWRHLSCAIADIPEDPAEERRIAGLIAKHGSLMAAMRAGEV